ncbi:MAG: hypothetical protein ACR2OB_15160 [Solirubrobacteraceae bacterium]
MFERDKVLVIERITVTRRLAIAEGQRAEVERVHGFHSRFCLVARSLEGAIDVRAVVELT